MTNQSIRTIARRSRLLLVGAVIAGLAACSATSAGTGSQGGSTANQTPVSVSSVEAKATTHATAADAQLRKDGYAATHIPGFGKVDLGFKNGTPRYEAVYTYTGSNPALVKDIVASAQQKLTGQHGVSVKDVDNLIVAQADSVHDLDTVVKAVLASLK